MNQELNCPRLLLVANLVRVAILVDIGLVADWRLLAEMLHVPLGVLGFVLACFMAVAMLRWIVPPRVDEDNELDSKQVCPSRPAWLVPLLGGVFLIMALVYVPRDQAVSAQISPTWQFPIDLLPG